MAKSNNMVQNPMSQDELLGLQNAVANVSLQDIQVGRVLDAMLSHLARLNNLDYPVVRQEEVPVEAPAQEQAPAEVAPSQEGA